MRRSSPRSRQIAQGFLARGDRVVHRLGEIALVGVCLQETGALDRREGVGEATRARVLRSRLSVRVECRRPPGGGCRVLEHCRSVGGALGMMRQAGQRVRGHRRAGPEGFERAPVKPELPPGGQRLQDRVAGELVAECEALAVHTEHAGGDAVPHSRGISPRDLSEEPRLAMRPDYRGSVERRPAGLREA